MKARLGDWECNLREWKMGKECIGAGGVGPGMRTSLIICLSVGSFDRGETEWQGR